MAELTKEQRDCVDELLRSYNLYDRYVDVVSIFEILFLHSQTEIPATVAHFERFPTIPAVGAPLTPDFTVAFRDGTGLIGEIARFGNHDESVDGLCRQLQTYSAVRELPISSTNTAEVHELDVLFLTPLDLGPAAVRRILEERLLNESHEFAPVSPVSIAQFGLDGDKYSIQRLVHPENPVPRDFERGLGLGGMLATSGSINMRAGRIVQTKAARAFMNDPVDQLYLATHLWAKTFATMASNTSDRPAALVLKPDELAAQIRSDHGAVRSSDVRRALELLSDARLATRHRDGRWTVAWEEIPEARRHDLQQVLAERACRRPKTGAIDRVALEDVTGGGTQESLF